MAGNKAFLAKCKCNEAMVKHNIEQIYSAMCIVLHNHGYSDDDIADFLAEVQNLWYEVANTPDANMCSICESLTGINISEVR